MLKIEYVKEGIVMSEEEFHYFKGKFVVNETVRIMESHIRDLTCDGHTTTIRYYHDGRAAVIPCCEKFKERINRKGQYFIED